MTKTFYPLDNKYMEKLENRNNIRLNNQLSIINFLRKEKCTITDLADLLEISFSATKHIVDELVEGGICKYSSKQAVNARGRTPVFVEINNKMGVVCGIDFSGRDIRVVLATLDGKPLVSKSITNVPFIAKEHLELIEKTIKELLAKQEVKGRTLLSICISSPGIINQKTFEYVSVYRVKDYGNMNPVSYFANAFNVDVEMYNDVRIGCLAELKFGAFPNRFFNGMFIHIGTAGGISLIYNGKIYEGSNGFAGETPLYNCENSFSAKYQMMNRIYALWEVVNDINDKNGLPKLMPDSSVDLEKLFKNYANKDPITVEAIEIACKFNALTIINLCTLLDLECVVIEGPILKFGPTIVNKICKYVNELSVYSIRTRIIESSLGSDSSLIGACYQAQTIYFHKSLEKLNRKRLKINEFNINPAFKEI